VTKRITIRLIGSDKDGGDVRLSEFIDQLEAFRDALKQTERILSGRDQQSIYYKIVGLSHSSPAELILEGVSPPRSPISAAKLTGGFISGLRGIRTRKKPPANSDLASLEAYKKLAAPLQRNVRRIEVFDDSRKVIPIDHVFTEKVEEIIGPDTVAFGSISGRLERVNLHNSLTFDIYPTVGPPRVRCIFQSDLKQKVKSALDGYCTVSGKLRYKQWDQYPYRIDANDIDSHQSNDELPSLHDLRGLAPQSTKGMSAEDFVRSIRHGNW
jgi:hypothetical protein